MYQNMKKFKLVDQLNLKNLMEEPEFQATGIESNPFIQKQPFPTIKIKTVDFQSNLFQFRIVNNPIIKMDPLQPSKHKKNMILSAKWN